MKNKEKVNLFDVIPYISEHITTEKEDGLSVVVFPRFRNKFMQKYFVPRGKSANIHIRLEEHGTAVWDLIDGNRTVKEITELLAEHFGQEENYEYRITTYIASLYRNGFIKYKTAM
ncbi:PqqD family protein [Bacteroides sedimenti]|uniref:PqqD family protein n=1 Tax=Bacteroides sedimenti TaxID=2136147 RepID=A0ABM8IAF5_9BACE